MLSVIWKMMDYSSNHFFQTSINSYRLQNSWHPVDIKTILHINEDSLSTRFRFRRYVILLRKIFFKRSVLARIGWRRREYYSDDSLQTQPSLLLRKLFLNEAYWQELVEGDRKIILTTSSKPSQVNASAS